MNDPFVIASPTGAALARRYYMHVREGGALTARDVERMVEALERLEAKLAEAVKALDEAVYLLAPSQKDMERQAGVYRIVTTLAELKGQGHE